MRPRRLAGPGRQRLLAAASLLATSLLAAALPQPLSAQRLAVGDADEEYLRVLQLLGRAPADASLLIRPLSMRSALVASDQAGAHPWSDRWGATFRARRDGMVHVHDPVIRGVFHSQFPEDRNEGALTPGRYLTGAVDGGVTIRRGGLTVSLRPTAAWVQNSEFPLAPVEVAGQPEFAYPWKRMDAPQRFGPDAYWQMDPGQSEVRIDVRGVSAKVGTTNLWWGPGRHNAILMSNNAAGIPHASLETSRPLDVGIGRLEAQWLFGRLQGTEYWDPAREDRGRYLTGAALAFSPAVPGLHGLSLGAARVFYAEMPEGGLQLGEYFLVFQTPIKASLATPDNPGGDDGRDQMFSAFARWVLPESGFEVYGEWARNDHSDGALGYFLGLGNTQAYTLGLQKATELSGRRILVLHGELTQLDNPADTRVYRARPTYYAHHFVDRGYTQKGQVIGASLGSGGTGQHFGADLYAPWGRASTYFRRMMYDRDAWLNRHVNDLGGGSMDGQAMLGGAVMLFRGSWDLVGELERSWRFNRFFRPGADKANLRLVLRARWRLGWEPAS